VSITEPSRPIIVCGYARSGTSLLGQVLRTSKDVVMFPEMSVHSTTAQFDLLAEVRATIRAQKWRGFTNAHIEARIVELLRRIWGAGRDPDLHDDTGQPRFGLKQPHAEEFHLRFAETLGDFRPQWVYTVRDPATIYHSTLRMSAFGDVEPEQFIHRLRGSVAAAAQLQAEGDAIVVRVDRVSGDADFRERKIDEVFAFLELEVTPAVAGFVAKWPPINVSDGENRGALSDPEVEARVDALRGHSGYSDLMAELEHLS
jgi:hypothetical protein